MSQFNLMPDPSPKLMYRQPGGDTHQNITDVLDEIILKLRDLETRLNELENKD